MNRAQQQPETQRRVLASSQRPRRTPALDTELMLPGWVQIPATRRQRLVAVLGELVQKRRGAMEDADDGA